MFLPGDVNSDGLLTEEDTEMIESESLNMWVYTAYWQLYIAQIYSYTDILEFLYAYEAENNYVHDGVNYFTNDALRQYAGQRFNSL